MQTIIRTDIKELKKIYTGKVRDIYEIDSRNLLMVTTDRISAFDVVFNQGIPGKGIVLNTISNKWFRSIDLVQNHIVSTNPVQELPFLNNYEGIPERAVIIKKVKRLPVECVVRGHLFGSLYDEYIENRTVEGLQLPNDLKLAQELPQPIFTPATKAEIGHDQNIDQKSFFDIVGREVGEKIIDISLSIYQYAYDLVKHKGIILADTKFEFGLDDGDLILIDELLTPDSSRYWLAESFRIGESPKSYDKQFVRDYLKTLDWDKTPPAPVLPEKIINKTVEKYREIMNIIESIET